MISPTTKSLILNPAPLANEATVEQGHNHLARYAAAPAGVLEQRLQELDHEWDVERLMVTLSALILLGSVLLVWLLGADWLVLSGILAGCLLLHGLFRWTPALPLLRCLGYRTPEEIAHERYALKALRGDFQPKESDTTAQDREDLSRFESEGGSPAQNPEPGVSTRVVAKVIPTPSC
jgi:hypothetical protein